MQMLPTLSVLQLWPALETIRMAQQLEAYGYHRLWLSEHHDQAAFSGSPLILTAIIAGITQRMRIGPAGVLLPYHSPLKVAEDVRMLELAFPGRIDLGIARATERDPGIAEALLDGRLPESAADGHAERVRKLLFFLGREGDGGADPARVAVPREAVSRAEVWILGTSEASAQTAARLGASFAFSRIINPSDPAMGEAIAAYRRFFTAAVQRQPQVCVAVAGLCSETDAVAEASLPDWARERRAPLVVGSGVTCRRQLRDLAERYGIDEFAFVDLSLTEKDRLTSYRILADACARPP